MLISPEYKRLNAALHANTDYGTSGHQYAGTVADLAHRLGTNDILDYGCGKGTLRAALAFPIKQYDPCIDGLDATPAPADIVVCGDVLEHIEPDCLDAVLDDLQRVVQKVGVFIVSTRSARRTLDDGRNAHLIQQPFAWWQEKLTSRFDIIRSKVERHGFLAFVTPKVARKERQTINGFVWPDGETESARAAFNEVEDLGYYYEFCKGFDIAVQAGGNCGVWPKYMAAKFGLVYTFEPDPENFNCLAINVQEHNVVKMQAALGNERGLIDIISPHGVSNCGSKYVARGKTVPVVRIDDLALPGLDFLMLDVEGAEVDALKGAMETIAKYRPLVVVENKPHTERFGYPIGTSIAMLEAIGYRVVMRRHADVVMSCA